MKPCKYASDAKGRSAPNRGPPRLCEKGHGDDGTVYELVHCPGCGDRVAPEPVGLVSPSAGPSVVPYPCPHRSAKPVGAVGCGTCRGRVELRVFACAVHPEGCTIETAAAGRKCCANCASRPPENQ